MNRRYTTTQFEEIANKLRDTFSDVILTTDIIVGFPGETDQEFETTYEFLKKIKFYKMHIFKYSSRKGTKAENFVDQVDGNIKEIRSNKLIDMSNENEINYLQSYIGKSVNVLFEEEKGGRIKGHTSNYIMVEVDAKYELDEIINNIEPVTIIDVDKEKMCLYGDLEK